ncbi:hypothetical protein AVEN_262530-1, partial [Araneus ventricosus]
MSLDKTKLFKLLQTKPLSRSDQDPPKNQQECGLPKLSHSPNT